MQLVEGGITAVRGFEAAGVSAGIKKNGKADMAMILSKVPCLAAGTFTSNRVKAAPVIWDRDHILIKKEPVRAVVVNSGIANACTGKLGLEACQKTASAAAAVLGLPEDSVLLGSTGVIGRQLPLDRITRGVELLAEELGDTLEHGHQAAQAIMTTDTVPKEVAVSLSLSDGTEVMIGGMCKGSGMIHPNMCTMLAFLGTDAAMNPDRLQQALSEVVPDTFNMVSVDGDTSTNDTCILLANGLAGNSPIETEDEDYRLFKDALRYVCESLAKMMAKDGEGATCLFECQVIHADTKDHAKQLARSVVSSTLTKAAIAGHDANWGRILCALGYSGVDFDPDKVDLCLISSAGRIQILEDGVDTGYSEEQASEILSKDEIRAVADMKMGDADAAAWGCDITHEYIRINADYRS